MAIVCDLQKLQATFFDKNFKIGGASIDSVLNQFFQSMDWSNNYFPGSNFVDNVWIESLKNVRKCMAREMRDIL
jgi:hypothetical protein